MSGKPKNTNPAFNVTISGTRTSIRMEPLVLEILQEIAERERTTVSVLAHELNTRLKEGDNLSSALRIFALNYMRQAVTEDGHARARHGAGTPFRGTPWESRAPSTVRRQPKAKAGSDAPQSTASTTRRAKRPSTTKAEPTWTPADVATAAEPPRSRARGGSTRR